MLGWDFNALIALKFGKKFKNYSTVAYYIFFSIVRCSVECWMIKDKYR